LCPTSFPSKLKGGGVDVKNTTTTTTSAEAASSCQVFCQTMHMFSERQLLEFYKKLETEYGFKQLGYHGEQDWSEYVISCSVIYIYIYFAEP
jgi:hypothetical protein